MTISKTATSFAVRAPLLAFERVFRRTGTLRRTLTFHNPGDRPLELRVGFEFREHSWIQIVPHGGADDQAGSLTIGPGSTQVHLLMDTDSSNFPYDRFRGRISFAEPDADGRPLHWIEISFEEIEELQDFEGYAAIDLGTSNSVVALYHLQDDALDGEPWNPTLEKRAMEVPSAVFIRDLDQFRKLVDGSFSVGCAALDEYRRGTDTDPRSLLLGVKRLIGSERILGVDAHGAGGYLDPLSVMQTLVRAIRERAQGHSRVRSRLRRLMVTFPPTWDYGQIDRWKEVFRRLGFADEDLDLSLDEASAAGLFHVFRWMRDADSRNRLLQDQMASQPHDAPERADDGRHVLRLLSFDFGGGTIDLALIEVTLTVRGEAIRMRVTLEGSDSLDFGGDQVTLAVFRILKRRLAMALSDPRRASGGEQSAEAGQRDDATAVDRPGRFVLPGIGRTAGFAPTATREQAAREICRCWDQIEQGITAERLPDGLDAAVDAMFCTKFWNSEEEPIRPDAKRNFGWLWDRAESLKRQLFREASRRGAELSLTDRADDRIRAGIPLADVPDEIAGRSSPLPADAGAQAWVEVGEIHACIAGPLEAAVASARRLADERGVDRIVLTGQSSWIPLVRRLFMRPRSEGGFGLAANKIEFDEENAKAAVSKGACLLRILREALVGIDVDVTRFRANLLNDIYYRSTAGGDRMLFPAGPIDDLRYIEDSPDPTSFPRHLSVFCGSPSRLMGQFDFGSGEPLPSLDPGDLGTTGDRTLPADIPTHAGFLDGDEDSQRTIRETLAEWPESLRIAWMEDGAAPGSAARPLYRFYLTRNRNLLVVRDRGDDKALFRLRVDRRSRSSIAPWRNPFSGLH